MERVGIRRTSKVTRYEYTGGRFEAPNGLKVFRLRRDFRPALEALRGDQRHLIALSVKRDAAQALNQQTRDRG